MIEDPGADGIPRAGEACDGNPKIIQPAQFDHAFQPDTRHDFRMDVLSASGTNLPDPIIRLHPALHDHLSHPADQPTAIPVKPAA